MKCFLQRGRSDGQLTRRGTGVSRLTGAAHSFSTQRGVALVLTLIMLSVITFLTVAFLAVSRRDRASVTTSLNQTDSQLMADTALARVQSEMTTQIGRASCRERVCCGV